jgi:hypothetical protein
VTEPSQLLRIDRAQRERLDRLREAIADLDAIPSLARKIQHDAYIVQIARVLDAARRAVAVEQQLQQRDDQ